MSITVKPVTPDFVAEISGPDLNQGSVLLEAA